MLLKDVAASFEYRLRDLNKELAPLESGSVRCGERSSESEDWRDVTETRIARIRHQIREAETIISRLKTVSEQPME